MIVACPFPYKNYKIQSNIMGIAL